MSKHAYRVLTGFDGSREAEQALRLAFEQAGTHPLSSVHVVRILPRHDLVSGSAVGLWGHDTMSLRVPSGEHVKLERDVSRIFGEWSKSSGSGIGRIEVHTRADRPASGILELAEELDVDLIVVGTHGRKGLRRYLFGSVAETIVREATCPVLVAHLDSNEDVPQIEPPCPKCLEARFASGGAQMWCARHSEHHTFGHKVTHSSRPMQPHVGSM